MGFNFSNTRDDTAGNDDVELVHIDEFIQWFLPAMNEILTVQTFMNETATTNADICAVMERYGNPSPAPFPK